MRDYQLVTYKGKKYCICRYKKRDRTSRLFVIDGSDLKKILGISHLWYEVNGYIGYSEMINSHVTRHYLHNLIMDRMIDRYKSKKYEVRHINNNIYDNRKINLRISEHSLNKNQKIRKRKCKLPIGSGLRSQDIPKYVTYCKAQGNHGDYFAIELKIDGSRKSWKSTKSKNILLRDKLIEIKKKLLDIACEYPELAEEKNILRNYTDKQIKLMKEFNEIIKKSDYACAYDNLIEIPKAETFHVNINDASKETRRYIKSNNTAIKIGRKHINALPRKCGITYDMIPKYCYYLRETDNRGDGFGISSRHPMSGGKGWITSRSKKFSLKRKFTELKKKLREFGKRSNKKSHTSNRRYGSKTSRKTSKTDHRSKTNRTYNKNYVEI